MGEKKRSGGVRVEEVSSGTRPIEAVGTAVAAFVGLARSHPLQVVVAVAVAAAVAGVVVRAVRR